MISSPIDYDHADVARIGGKAMELAMASPLTQRCECPLCGSTSLRLLGLSSIDGSRISLLTHLGTSAKQVNAHEPMTLAIAAKCSLGHEFSTVIRQVGSEIHQATWLPD